MYLHLASILALALASPVLADNTDGNLALGIGYIVLIVIFGVIVPIAFIIGFCIWMKKRQKRHEKAMGPVPEEYYQNSTNEAPKDDVSVQGEYGQHLNYAQQPAYNSAPPVPAPVYNTPSSGPDYSNPAYGSRV